MRKKLLACLTAVLLLFCAPLSGCSSSGIKAAEFAADAADALSEYQDPQVIDISKRVSGYTTDSTDGKFLLLSKTSGTGKAAYDIAADKLLFDSAGYTALTLHGTYFRATAANGLTVILNIAGDVILPAGEYSGLAYSAKNVYRGASRVYAAEFAWTEDDKSVVKYFGIDGGVISTSELTGYSESEYEKGDKVTLFRKSKQLYNDKNFFDPSYYDAVETPDAVLEGFSVYEAESGEYTFFNNGEMCSEWKLQPDEEILGYVDGKILFVRAQTVDPMATKGYNCLAAFEGAAYKAKYTLCSFDIKKGKIKELKTDYVIVDTLTQVYNYKDKAFNGARASVVIMQGGIAVIGKNSDATSAVIDAKGKFIYSSESVNSYIPQIKLNKKRFIGFNMTKEAIIDQKGKVVSDLGGLFTDYCFADYQRIVLAENSNQYILTDYDGNVVSDRKFTGYDEVYYGGKVLIRDENDEYAVYDFINDTVTSFKTLLNGNDDDTYEYAYGVIIRKSSYSGTVGVYTLTGSLLCSGQDTDAYVNQIGYGDDTYLIRIGGEYYSYKLSRK